jgi:EAL domain-containing protein (putative c-di-GMP-specific phosphodiesterase class I)
VVAEGVATAQELAILREMGSDLVQGYFFFKPMAA